MLEFKYDTQLLIEGENLDEDEISEYFTEHFKGDCLLAVGDDDPFSHQRALESAGILRVPRRDLRHCSRRYGSSVQRSEGLRRKRELSVFGKKRTIFL